MTTLKRLYHKVVREFYPLYVPGENYFVYINLEEPATNFNDPDYMLGITSERGGLPGGDGNFYRELAPVTKDVLPDNSFNIWAQFDLPVLQDGFYRFVVYRVADDTIIAASNTWQVNAEYYDICSTLIFKNGDEDKYGYGFSRVEGLEIKNHVPLIVVDEQFETDASIYRNATNTRRLRNIASYRDTVYTLEAYFFDSGAHEAMHTALEMKYLYINGQRFIMKAGSYKIQSRPQELVTKATFEVYAQDEFLAGGGVVISDRVLAEDNGFVLTEDGSFTLIE